MVMETIKRNPIPAALAGAGLALLWANRAEGSQDMKHAGTYGYRSQNGGSSEGIGDAASKVGGAVESVAEGAQHVGGEVIGRADETVEQVSWKLESFMRANPLAMAAIAAGAGAVIASIVPETSKEREVLGDASRQVTSAVRDTVEEAATKAEETMDRAEEQVGSPA
jgi:hypothetical protein